MAERVGPVCVIGAGIAGASAAFHLIEAGRTDVVVVDAGEPFSGTTPAGAGFLARFGADHNRRLGSCTVALQDYALSFYRALHEDGADLEFARRSSDWVTASCESVPVSPPMSNTCAAAGVAAIAPITLRIASFMLGLPFWSTGFLPDCAVRVERGPDEARKCRAAGSCFPS